jgi:hypothetical protein
MRAVEVSNREIWQEVLHPDEGGFCLPPLLEQRKVEVVEEAEDSTQS